MENGKTIKIEGFYATKKMKRIIQWSPLWVIFKERNRNRSSFARTISASRQSFFANLTTFKRHSGLK